MSVEFNKKVVRMVTYLERLAHDANEFQVEEAVDLGTDFLLIGAYLLTDDFDNEQFAIVMQKIWERVNEVE